MIGSTDTLSLRLHAISDEAEGIRSFDLRLAAGGELPGFTAGAHIEVTLPNGLMRSYSLINPQGERHRYVIAVNRDAASRGGSAFMHDKLAVGDTLTVRPPRNNFALDESAGKSLLIAGGIGVTPLWCMVQRLNELNRPWELYYSTRTPRRAPFLAALAEAACDNGTVHLNFDHEPGGKMLDIKAIVAGMDARTHLYCCGPAPMLKAFEEACVGRPDGTVHVEYFTPAEELDTTGEGFTVVLARSGQSFFIEPGKTILEVLLDSDIEVDFSCQEGICGTCQTTVLEGVPDHRDSVLSDEEQESNRVMTICCSRAKTARLVLDL